MSLDRPPTTQAPEAHDDDRSPATGVVLGFVGLVILMFGLPMAVALPAGLIWGKRHDAVTVLSLIGVTALGLVFVYAAVLLLRAAVRAALGKPIFDPPGSSPPAQHASQDTGR